MTTAGAHGGVGEPGDQRGGGRAGFGNQVQHIAGVWEAGRVKDGQFGMLRRSNPGHDLGAAPVLRGHRG